jgi:hypothetical protein
MSKKDEPKIMFADEEWGGFGEAVKDNEDHGPTMNPRLRIKVAIMQALHPFGIHYYVPAYGHVPGGERWVEIGTTCWFCNG